MNKRLLCLGLAAAAFQLLATGCHPVARWRANHPCLSCGPLGSPAMRPLLHPIQTRRAILGDAIGPVGDPVMVGPSVGLGGPPCHGCGTPGVPGVPVSFSGGHFEGAPGGYPPIVISSSGGPSIGSPMPIMPGPGATPSNLLPHPMPLPKQ